MALETGSDTDIDTIAQVVRQRRTQLGLSQATAAKQAGISRRAWSEIELGQRRGGDETLSKIADVLQLSPGSLVALERRPNGELAEIRRELISIINLLTTREELEQARVDMLQIRFNTAKAQLDRYASRRDDLGSQ